MSLDRRISDIDRAWRVISPSNNIPSYRLNDMDTRTNEKDWPSITHTNINANPVWQEMKYRWFGLDRRRDCGLEVCNS